MHHNYLVFIVAVVKVIRLNHLFDLFGMVCIFGHNQHKRFNNTQAIITGVFFQLHFCMLMQADTVLHFKTVNFLRGEIIRLPVFAGSHIGLFNKPVLYGFG